MKLPQTFFSEKFLSERGVKPNVPFVFEVIGSWFRKDDSLYVSAEKRFHAVTNNHFTDTNILNNCSRFSNTSKNVNIYVISCSFCSSHKLKPYYVYFQRNVVHYFTKHSSTYCSIVRLETPFCMIAERQTTLKKLNNLFRAENLTSKRFYRV